MNRFLDLERELRLYDNNSSNFTLQPSRARTRTGRKSHSLATFTSKGLDDGNVWLKIKIGSHEKPLSRYARVKDLSRVGNREHFTIVDWPYENQRASVSEQSASASRFKTVSYDDAGGLIVYNRSRKELTYGSNRSPIKSFMSNALQAGNYKLFVPDHPHVGGQQYLSLSKYATVWFRIDAPDSNDRYLHMGSSTAGCVTCGEVGTAGGTDADKRRWTEVYKYLINKRLKRSPKYVGILKIV
ncbi:MAG: hypothetical protein AAF587_37615 [Bacteroidota bacterium]